MPNFLRSLSQRLTKPNKNRQAHQGQQQHEPRHLDLPSSTAHCCQCKVQLLDQTDLNLAIGKSALGQELYDRVFSHLELEERDYFGLQFTDQFQVQHWLDPAKKVRKQIPIGPPFTLRIRVKFFSNEPTNLREELTRYLFFLQLRQDIQTGRLECPREVVVELAALALQSEFGDFNRREHSSLFVSEFHFSPAQDEQMEASIISHWAGGQLTGFSPCQAEMAFLDKARQLPLYGVDLHPVLGRDGQAYRLGLSPQGMLVLDGGQKIGLFLWEKIQQLDFRGHRLSLVVEEDLPAEKRGQLVQLHTFLFQLASSRAAKHLWKCAIEFHTFYRLKFPRPSQNPRGRVLPPLFRLGSTFRYRGRTEYETLHRRGDQQEVSPSGRRCSSAERPLFRRPSRRFTPRWVDQRTGPSGGGQQGPTLIIPIRNLPTTTSTIGPKQPMNGFVPAKPLSTEL